MTMEKSILTRLADCSTTVSLVDTGSTYTTGHLSIYTSDMTKITWHALSNPSFCTPFGDGTSTAYPVSDATAFIDATANNFAFENRDGSAIWTGDVTLINGGGSLQLQQISIPQDTTVVISSAVYIVP
jgi:hypothetical protein